MKTRVILESLPLNKNEVETLLVLSSSGLGHKIFAALPILCIAVFKGRENWISLYQTENIYPHSTLVWEYGVLQKKFGQCAVIFIHYLAWSTLIWADIPSFCINKDNVYI